VDPLIAALQDGASDVRKEAIRALGRIHDERAIDPIIALLQDADSEVRRAAVRTLGQFPARRH
jgi:HEAT repeat protein